LGAAAAFDFAGAFAAVLAFAAGFVVDADLVVDFIADLAAALAFGVAAPVVPAGFLVVAMLMVSLTPYRGDC
jgi:hypothetical protein